MANARMLVASRTEQHHIRNGNATFAIRECHPSRSSPGFGARVALDHARMFDSDALLRRVHREHAAGLAFIAARHHADLIVLADGDAMPRELFAVFSWLLPNLGRERNNFGELLSHATRVPQDQKHAFRRALWLR